MAAWGAPAAAQVISGSPTASVPGASFLGSARLQFGITQPASYQGAVLGGGEIKSAQQAAVVAAGGFVVSTNPPFWSQVANNAFSLSYAAATQTMTLTVRRPNNAIQFSISDTVNFTGAQGLTLGFLSSNASQFTVSQVTAAGVTQAVGPGSAWSGTALRNSMLTGWDLTNDWSVTGSIRLLNAGADADPRLQANVITDGLGYQLSSQGAGRPEVYNYGVFQQMVVKDAEFLQAQYGGVDGVVQANIQSKGAVSFDIAGAAELAGGVFDLTSALVAPADRGTADLVKTGAGTLILSGTSNYSGKLKLQDGITVLRDASGIGAGGLEIGTAQLTLDVDPSLGAGDAVTVLGDATIAAGAESALNLGATITGAAGTALTLQDLDTTFTGNALAMAGGLVVNGGSFTMSAQSLAGDVTATNGAVFDATGSIGGNLTVSGSVLLASGAIPALPGTLAVVGSLTLDAGSIFAPNVFLTNSAPGQRESDRVNVTGNAAMAGTLQLVLNTAVSPGSFVPGRGVSETWQLISAPGTGTGQFSTAELLVIDPMSSTTETIALPVNGTSIRGAVQITTLFDASGATVTLLGIAQDPNARIQTACGTVSGADINALVDHLMVVEATGDADASAIATDLLMQMPEVIPPAYAATQQQNPYATPNVVMDSNFMAGQTAMLRLMQMRDGALGAAAGKVADASGGHPVDMTQPSAIGSPLNGPTPDEGARPWMRGYGFWENVDDADCAQCGYDASIGGAMAGMDWAVDGGGIVGAFAGLGPGVVNMDGWYGHEQDNVTDVMFGIYGSVVPKGGTLYAEGFLMGGYTSVDRARTIALPGATPRLASSSNDAWSLTAGGELGLNLSIGERSWLQPYLGLSWSNYWGGSYSETGASSLDLTVDSQSCSLFQPTVGARLLHSYMIGRDMLTPYVGLAFLAQLPTGGWAPTYTSAFNLGQATSTLSGPPDRYGGNIQAGLEFATVKGVNAYIAFDGAVMTDKQRFGGQIGVFVPF